MSASTLEDSELKQRLPTERDENEVQVPAQAANSYSWKAQILIRVISSYAHLMHTHYVMNLIRSMMKLVSN